MIEPVTAPQATSRSTAIDALKGIAILGVLLHHVGNRRLGDSGETFAGAASMATQWCVYAFLFAAGFLAAGRRSKPNESLGSRVLVRAQRLLIPYLALGAAYAAIRLGIEHFVPRLIDPVRFPPGILPKLQNLLVGGNRVAEQIYFFPLLFATELLSLAFCRGQQRWIPATAASAGLAGCWIVAISGHVPPFTGLSLGILVPALCQYLAGWATASWMGRTQVPPTARWMACGACLLGGALLKGHWHWLFSALMPITTVSLLEAIKAPAWMDHLGRASSTIFAYHSPYIIHPGLILILALGVPDLPAIFATLALVLGSTLLLHHILNSTPRLAWMRV